VIRLAHFPAGGLQRGVASPVKNRTFDLDVSIDRRQCDIAMRKCHKTKMVSAL